MKNLKQLVLTFALGLALAVGVQAADSKSSSKSTKSTGAMTEVKVKDLTKHPEKFAGQTVMVSGTIKKVEGASSFVLDGPGMFNDQILVFVSGARTPSSEKGTTTTPVIREDEKVMLTGKLEQLTVTKIEERYGPMETELKEEFEGAMPVFVVAPDGIKPKS